MLSIGGILTLLNSVLTTIPLYALSVYKLPLTVIKMIDKIRRRFLWQGNSKKKKYILLDWYTSRLTKSFGGLGILDLRQMNIFLLLKWWWKLKNNEYHALWKTLIIYKYMITHTLFVSPFWSSTKLSHIGEMSNSYTPGIHTQVKFWLDIWYQNCSLATKYYSLFSKCTNKTILLANVIISQGQIL